MDVGATIVAAQSLSTTPKIVITVVGWLLGAGLTYFLWQKPLEVDDPSSARNSIEATNTISKGQTGGINAGVYINQAPPITDQQKAEAIASLQSELGELADFPNGPDVPAPPSQLQSMLVDKAPHRLYAVLVKYYRQTILDVPLVGSRLYAYKTKYYEFEDSEHQFEQEVTLQAPKIIEEKGMTKIRMPQIWQASLIYFIFRSTGQSEEDVKNSGLMLIEIGYDQQEKVFQELTKDPKFGPRMAEQIKRQNELSQESQVILSKFAHR